MVNAKKEKVTKGYIRALDRFIGPVRDVPALDVYTTPHITAWMMNRCGGDEAERLDSIQNFAIFNGGELCKLIQKKLIF